MCGRLYGLLALLLLDFATSRPFFGMLASLKFLGVASLASYPRHNGREWNDEVY